VVTDANLNGVINGSDTTGGFPGVTVANGTTVIRPTTTSGIATGTSRRHSRRCDLQCTSRRYLRGRSHHELEMSVSPVRAFHPAACLQGANSRRRVSAFTLIELLIVVGLIALLVGAVGMALGGTGSTALASAQNSVASLAGTARAQGCFEADGGSFAGLRYPSTGG